MSDKNTIYKIRRDGNLYDLAAPKEDLDRLYEKLDDMDDKLEMFMDCIDYIVDLLEGQEGIDKIHEIGIEHMKRKEKKDDEQK